MPPDTVVAPPTTPALVNVPPLTPSVPVISPLLLPVPEEVTLPSTSDVAAMVSVPSLVIFPVRSPSSVSAPAPEVDALPAMVPAAPTCTRPPVMVTPVAPVVVRSPFTVSVPALTATVATVAESPVSSVGWLANPPSSSTTKPAAAGATSPSQLVPVRKSPSVPPSHVCACTCPPSVSITPVARMNTSSVARPMRQWRRRLRWRMPVCRVEMRVSTKREMTSI